MRGRIVIAVILLAAALFALRLAIVARDFDAVVTAAAFDSARDNHTALRVFLNRMPKGGDLHTHLSGSVYAEHFIMWAAARELCVDIANMLLAKLACERTPGAVAVVDALRDQRLYDRLVNAFSMRAFLPTPSIPTGHDEFFATFDRFNAASSGHFVDMAADQLRQYDRENVQYVELMVSFSCPNERERLRAAIKDQTDGPIYVSGSGTLVRALLRDGLVDDLHLFVYPIALGQGQRLWADGDGPTKLALKAHDAYENGVVHLAYGPA